MKCYTKKKVVNGRNKTKLSNIKNYICLFVFMSFFSIFAYLFSFFYLSVSYNFFLLSIRMAYMLQNTMSNELGRNGNANNVDNAIATIRNECHTFILTTHMNTVHPPPTCIWSLLCDYCHQMPFGCHYYFFCELLLLVLLLLMPSSTPVALPSWKMHYFYFVSNAGIYSNKQIWATFWGYTNHW